MSPYLAVVAILLVLMFLNHRRFRSILHEADYQAGPIKRRVLPVPRRFRQILLKYFPYYGKLSAADRKKFEKKTMKFIYGKRFIPRGVPEVTIEAKVLISASAVQLTFGLPDITFAHFNKILVYPNDYYSSITRRYHKGEVNPRFGIIVLSWQSFIDGYIHNTDSFNLGLHEMAHALRLENVIRNEEYDFIDAELLAQFDQFAHAFCQDPGAMATGLIRAYACTNTHEFFSVSVENFFERPVALKQGIPVLYDLMSRLLNQDPASLHAA
jgi:Mlc titration factor MtfA (ptsG expression regulator)